MNKKFIDKYIQETIEIVGDINKEEIDKFINILFNAWKNKKKVISMGNGGSASTASHFAGDLVKTVVNPSSKSEISETKGFKAMCLNDNQPALTAWINDSGWDKAYSGLLNTLLEEGDVILLISVHGGSGWSNNLAQAMDLAKKRKAKIIGLSGFDGGKIKEMADVCVVIPKNSTSHVEGLHSVIQHLIIWRLKELIEEESKSSTSSTLQQLKISCTDSIIKERLDVLISKYETPKTKIKFFADTANLNELEYCFSSEINDGITTNPKIIESTGDSSLSFEKACKTILEKYTDVPVSLESDLRGISISDIYLKPEQVRDSLLKQAEEMSKWGNNVVIKIPICEGGILATKILSEKGIKTNVTACMTPYQALKAAEAGATYVSLFANRMLDSHIFELSENNLEIINKIPNWKNIIKENKEKYFEEAWERTLNQIAYVAKKLEKSNSQLIVGSIREPEDIYKIAKAGPQIITIPFKMAEKLKNISSLKETERSLEPTENVIFGDSIFHPMTHYILEEFERSAISVGTR